ncbi:hypothetical protein ACFPKY_15025 [Nocardioides caricicola]|uniref:DUF4245 domain-containing protein n=2 Tax=Nocardioides caricicola TaxID=634770 RepID=A0ABW0N373_9ACTN
MIVGIVLGLLILTSMVLFSVVLPEATGDDEGSETHESLSFTLPDTLPGGYAAADLESSFDGGELAAQAAAIAEQQGGSTEYGNEVLPEVLDTSAVTRSYVVNGTEAVFVQVMQAEGGAFSPSSLTDPESTDGAGGITMQKVGDGVCILTSGATQMGAPGPTASECQVSHDGVTVQVSSDTVAAEDLVGLAADVFKAAVEPAA